MTTTPHPDYSTMEARELDALVAVALMGWEHRNDHWWQTRGGYAANTVTFDKVPHYSTDIACAFQVVEKMRERGWLFKLTTQPDNDEWIAFFWRFGVEPKYWAMNNSKERTICLAALAALESQG